MVPLHQIFQNRQERALPRTLGKPHSPKAGSRNDGFPGHSGARAQRRDPLSQQRSGSGLLGPEGGVGARGSPGGGGLGVKTRRPGPLPWLRSPCPGSTAAGQRPRPRACVPGGPIPELNSRGRAAGGPSRGPRTGAVGSRAAVPVAAAIPGRRRRWRRGWGAACALPARGPVRGAPALSLSAAGPAQLSAPSPLTSYLSPPSPPPSARVFSGPRMRTRTRPAAPSRPLADASHRTERKGKAAGRAGRAWIRGPHHGF